MGSTLVDWAARATALEDLKQRIEARKKQPTARIPAMVLEVQIALATKDEKEAASRLVELKEAANMQAILPNLQLACHAAIPAVDHPSLEESAIGILTKFLELQSQQKEENREELGKLNSIVNRYLANSGNEEAVKKYFDDFMVRRQTHYARYDADYGQYRQKRDMARLAKEAAITGVTDVAMDFVGRVFDTKLERYRRPGVESAMVIIRRELSGKSAQERYETWLNWTMPIEARKTVRVAAEWVELSNIPEPFLAIKPLENPVTATELISNFTELVASAAEANTLDELREISQKAYEEEIPNAEFLLPIVLLEMDDFESAEPIVKQLVNSVKERNMEADYGRYVELWGDYLVYRKCMQKSSATAKWWDSGVGMLKELLGENPNTETLGYLQHDIARREAANRGATIQPGDSMGLKYWLPVYAESLPGIGLKPWWVEHENHIVHLTGPKEDLLYLAFPLTGNFEFSVDSFMGDWSEGEVGYGGIVVKAHQYGSRAKIWSVDDKEEFYRQDGPERGRERYDRIKVQVRDGKALHYLNNHLIYEDHLTGNNPWLLLYADGQNTTTFRNFSITGNPVIPREVALINDDRMDGWNTKYFDEDQPRKRLMAEKPEDDRYVTQQQEREPSEFDWEAKDGVLIANAHPKDLAERQSWAYYHRPLQNGETFRYEFFYIPGQSVAHPTLGRVAMLLEPEDVKLHWIVREGWDNPVYQIPEDNEISLADEIRGEMNLLPNEWNSVELTLLDDKAKVKVNGTVVYEHAVASVTDRRFGLFRYRRQNLKVRQAVLSGDWPAEYSPHLNKNLLAAEAEKSKYDGQVINRVVGDAFFTFDIENLLSKAKALPEEDAFALLRDWVLPSADHAGMRLYYQLPTRQQKAVYVGDQYQLACPAIELMKIAKRTNRLDEVLQSIQDIDVESQLELRLQSALYALAAIAKGDDQEARYQISELYRDLKTGLPEDLLPSERVAEFVVAWAAAERPTLKRAAADLADLLREVDIEEDLKKEHIEYKALVKTLIGRTRADTTKDKATAFELTQWQSVPYETRTTRALGYRPSSWHYDRGVVNHVPGETWNQLFFQSPLQGKFEIVAERTTGEDQSISIAYGMYAAEPDDELDGLKVSTSLQNSKDRNADYELPNWGEVAEFKIAVDNSNVATYVNEVQIHKQSLSPQPAPWVTLHALSPGNFSSIRNLRILGTPEIPDEIRLIESSGMACWRADVYNDLLSDNDGDDDAAWQRVGEEIRGTTKEDNSDTTHEGLLMYQRPMLEDGEIEFEAYYSKDQFEVHPAIGRFAFLIQADGVYLHEMTAAEWENSDLSPNNATAIKTTGKIALKQKDWNQYRLSLQGDVLTIFVNGTAVAEHALQEPLTARFFGLFRYVDSMRCRVRNIVYRGDWPKELPSIDQQQLAYPKGGPFALQKESMEESMATAFNKSLEQLEQEGLKLLGSPNGVSTTDKGLRLNSNDNNNPENSLGIALNKSIAGDFEATLSFSDLTLAEGKESTETGVSIRVSFEDAGKSNVELGVFLDEQGQEATKTFYRYASPDGKTKTLDSKFGQATKSGRLVLLRHGNQLHCLLSDRDQQYRVLRSYLVGRSPATKIEILSKSKGPNGKVDVLLENFSLKTAKTGKDDEKVDAKISNVFQFPQWQRIATMKTPLIANQ